MNVNDSTIGEARALAHMFTSTDAMPGEKNHPFNIGKNYFIRTVTHHHTGKLVAVHDTELVLVDAAWIADDGRLTESLRDGNFNEVEMFPPNTRVIIGRGSIIDAIEISTIPTSRK